MNVVPDELLCSEFSSSFQCSHCQVTDVHHSSLVTTLQVHSTLHIAHSTLHIAHCTTSINHHNTTTPTNRRDNFLKTKSSTMSTQRRTLTYVHTTTTSMTRSTGTSTSCVMRTRPTTSTCTGRLTARSALVSLVCICILAALPKASSTITIAGTGQHFSSRPDRIVGSSWMDGVEYMARMQLIDSDPDLCPLPSDDDQNFTVTRPADGLPVVLLVRGHSCLDATKVDVALSKIRPKGVVKYMIIYNPSTSTTTTTTTSTTLHLEDVHSLPFSGSRPGSGSRSGASSYKEHHHQHAPLADFPMDWPFLTFSNSDHGRSGSHGRSLGDDFMNRIGVLSVSPETGKGMHTCRTVTGRVRVGCPSHSFVFSL